MPFSQEWSVSIWTLHPHHGWCGCLRGCLEELDGRPWTLCWESTPQTSDHHHNWKVRCQIHMTRDPFVHIIVQWDVPRHYFMGASSWSIVECFKVRVICLQGGSNTGSILSASSILWFRVPSWERGWHGSNNKRDLFYVIVPILHQLPGKVDPCRRHYQQIVIMRPLEWEDYEVTFLLHGPTVCVHIARIAR
jgi:hypothetical protein